MSDAIKKIRIVRHRFIAIAIIPILFGAALSVWLLLVFSHAELQRQSDRLGQAIADQLANTSIDYLVSKDILSLNVLLDDLLSGNSFDFAAIYDSDNKLLAQSGQQEDGQNAYTRVINFQNSTLGYVLIALDMSQGQKAMQNILLVTLSTYLLIASLTIVSIWFYGDLLFLWVTNRGTTKTFSRTRTKVEPASDDSPKSDDRTLLAIKIKPARLVPVEALHQACALYGGSLVPVGEEEWSIQFDTPDQLIRSLRCGLLIKRIIDLQTGKLTYRAGIDSNLAAELPLLRKQASYLASVAEENLLVSQRVKEEIVSLGLVSLVEVAPFHSSATAGGEVYSIESKDPLLDQQASQLA